MPFPIKDDLGKTDGAGESKNSDEPRAGARGGAGDAAGLVDRETVQEAIRELKNALQANKVVWGKTKEQFETSADWPTRVKAAELILAYGEGRPVERRIEIKANADTWEDQMKRHLGSAEGIRFLRSAGAITPDQADEALEKLAKNVKTASE